MQAASGLTVSSIGSNGEPINPQAMSASELYRASFVVSGRTPPEGLEARPSPWRMSQLMAKGPPSPGRVPSQPSRRPETLSPATTKVPITRAHARGPLRK